MIGYNEVLKALRIIKETCAMYDECYKCPLADGKYNCMVSDPDRMDPEKWKIKIDAPENIWRAFEEED